VRLAIVSPYAWDVPSGVNNHVTSLVSQLQHRGHEVWIIAPAGSLTHSAKALPDNFICAGRAFPVTSNGSVAYANGWPLMLQKMGRILARHEFDLVHVHEPTIPSVGCSATMTARVPVVGTFHAGGAAITYYERWRPLAERILACLAVRIVVSEAARDCVVSQFPADYRVIPNGIDVDAYAKARGGRKVRGRILFIGRPDPRKGLHIVVEAFRRLRDRVPGASLVLGGPTYKELHAEMARFGKSSEEDFRGITALGRLGLEAKVEQMRKAEVFCAPALGGESFGIVLTEAMAGGVPVVASNIPGYREVLAEGAFGVLVPPGDVSALENALFSTLRNPELRRDLAAGGTARAERYSWDRVVNHVVEAYEDALSLGPSLAEGPMVPVLRQARHFVRLKAPRGVKAREVGGRAVV
jgi:phosphatidylinositol alpha-mannosyltransferase